jgi:RNA polymerase sigma-70 factor (ECF subfamily)
MLLGNRTSDPDPAAVLAHRRSKVNCMLRVTKRCRRDEPDDRTNRECSTTPAVPAAATPTAGREDRDRWLLRKLDEGNEAALRTLYSAYAPRIHAFALARLCKPADTEEVVVDTVHEVWRHAARFRGESKFSTWLLGIARNNVHSMLQARTPVHDDIADWEDELAADEPGAFHVVAQRQRRQRVLVCIDKLSGVQRECVRLFFYEGLSLREVAEVQRYTENAAKIRLFHARRRLKQCTSLSVWRTETTSDASTPVWSIR